MKRVDLLVTHGLVVTMDEAGRVWQDGAVAIRDGGIVAVGSTSGLVERFVAAEELDAGGRIVLPGLINLHCHGADALFRGLVDDLELEPWLERLWRIERRFVTPATVEAGATLAQAEMIRGGTTTALDMFWFPEATARVARRVGFRLFNGPVFFDAPAIDRLADDERSSRAREFLEEHRRDRLVTPCVLAHGTYTVSPRGLDECRHLTERFGTLFSTHMSETTVEVDTVRQRYGSPPAEQLERRGLLSERSILAHCVHLEDDEIDLVADRGSVVAHCPLSNLKLGSGVAPVPELRRRGVRAGLGTDGPVSGNDLDMWLAMRLAAVLHKGVRRDPTLLPAREVLAMATREAAAALGRRRDLGSLAAGRRADLLVVDLDRPHLTPMFDVYSHLVYAVGRDDVRTVLIDGRIVMRDRQLLTLDEAAAREAVDLLAVEIGLFES